MTLSPPIALRLGMMLAMAMIGQPSQAQHFAIRWGVFDAPPFFIAREVDDVAAAKISGIGGELLDRLIQAMPDVDHSIAMLPVTRMNSLLEESQPICLVGATTNRDRDRYSQAIPFLVYPAVSVIMRAEVLNQHPDWRDGVDLAWLIRQPLRGQYLAGRSFGEEWRAILAESGPQSGLSANGRATPANQLRMIAAGRIDYGIDYSETLDDLIDKRVMKPGELVAIRLRDLKPLNKSYVLCPRSSWGDDASGRIDGALRRLAADPDYRALVYRLVPEATQPVYHAAFEQFFDERAEAGQQRGGRPH